MDEIDQLIKALDNNGQTGDYWANKCLELASHLFTLGIRVAEAETEEKAKIIEMLDDTPLGDKKMSVTEAEKRAVILTGNKYGLLRIRYESLLEIINAIKTKLRVMGWEYQKSGDAI